MSTAAFVPSSAMAKPSKPLPNCAGLAAQLLKNSDILAATSVVKPAASPHLSYCLVDITVSDLAGPKDGYQPGQKQMINIGIGLPLSTEDGGSGGVQGAWNGRIEDLGGGGYAGTVGSVTGATDLGYASSSTDTGHPASEQGFFALNPDDTLNWGLINDFAFNGIHEQALWTNKLTQMYYGMAPKFTYWNGCSTGGRQGHEQAQKYTDDFDGILAGASAFNWDRFIVAEQWGEVVMNQEVCAPILQAKLDGVSQQVIAACDPLDGITDGIIQDPRACLADANAYVCGEPGAAPLGSNCLTPQRRRSCAPTLSK
jgi:feruloyl esterase